MGSIGFGNLQNLWVKRHWNSCAVRPNFRIRMILGEQWRPVIFALEMWPISHQASQRLVLGIICQRWLAYSPLPLREMGLSSNVEKSAIKWEKGLSMKSYLHVVSTRDTFHACLWLEEWYPWDITPFWRWIVLTRWCLFSLSCSTKQVQPHKTIWPGIMRIEKNQIVNFVIGCSIQPSQGSKRVANIGKPVNMC